MSALSDGAIRQALKRVDKTRKQETLKRRRRPRHRAPSALSAAHAQARHGGMDSPAVARWSAHQVQDRLLPCPFACGRPRDLSAGFRGRDLEASQHRGCRGRARPRAQSASARYRPGGVLGVLRPIYERGTRALADHVRSYIHSAYSWGLKSELDYRSTSPRRFKFLYNPAANIPTEPKVRDTRWLDEDEFVRLYRWLECPDAPVHPPYTRAVRVLMLTGQRVQEIARLHIDQWDAAERIIDWSKTKNGRPHAIPVPARAAELIQSVNVNEYGWFFPSAMDPSKPVSHGTIYSFMWRQRERGIIPVVTNRDLRRTWKTLAGKAGVPKEIRDRIQNHALQDVSSKVYDRWTYMPEKRAGMDKWSEFVSSLLKSIKRQIAA